MARRPRRATLLNRSLMHAAARLHYMDGLAQQEVARRMEISTATVSRLLSLAREEGIVRITVVDLDETDTLGDRLAQALGLRAVRVTDSGRAAAGLAGPLGALLTGTDLSPRPTIAIGWGRTVQGIISAGLPRMPQARVIPAMGGMAETASHFQINEFTRMAAEQMGAEALLLHAPSTGSASLRAMLAEDPGIAKVTALWGQVDAAILGIGAFRSSGRGDRLDARAAGDVVRHYFTVEGEDIRWEGQENLLAITAAQLRRIPLAIGVAVGRDKTAAILGAARSRMINALVTDSPTARALLEALTS